MLTGITCECVCVCVCVCVSGSDEQNYKYYGQFVIYMYNHNNYIQVTSLATLALLLAAIGGYDMLLPYIFVIYVCRHAPIRSIRRMDCQSDI